MSAKKGKYSDTRPVRQPRTTGQGRFLVAVEMPRRQRGQALHVLPLSCAGRGPFGNLKQLQKMGSLLREPFSRPRDPKTPQDRTPPTRCSLPSESRGPGRYTFRGGRLFWLFFEILS